MGNVKYLGEQMRSKSDAGNLPRLCPTLSISLLLLKSSPALLLVHPPASLLAAVLLTQLLFPPLTPFSSS